MSEIYLTEHDVSKMIGRALSTLRNDRHLNKGIPYIRNYRHVRYRLSDVEQYMNSRRVETFDDGRNVSNN